jgi:CheY-like chemotaxis protein
VSRVVFCEDDPVIRKLVQIRPDVVFRDVAPPTMDGFKLADAMRARPGLAHIPIVFMTASVLRDHFDECFRHGAAGHLAKPFNVAELRASVAQFSTN